MSIIPALVEGDQLQPSNSLMQSSSQAVQGIGPGIAGVVINVLGIGLAVLLDALSFLVTTLTLLSMRYTEPARASAEAQSIHSIFTDIRSMVSYVLNDPVLRPYMLLILALNLSLIGPSTVGVPVLAKAHFGGSPLALG